MNDYYNPPSMEYYVQRMSNGWHAVLMDDHNVDDSFAHFMLLRDAEAYAKQLEEERQALIKQIQEIGFEAYIKALQKRKI